MNAEIKAGKIKSRIKDIERMIKSGIVTFNGYDSVEAAWARIEELKIELAEIQPELKEEKDRIAQRRKSEKLERHQRAQQWSRKGKNEYLREFGYVWRKEETAASRSDFDQYSEWRAEYARYSWQLLAPDGRVVSVEQAMKEIEESF